jgi:hypothetical protein
MTDTAPPAPELEALPTLVHVSQAFSARLPSQRVLDLISKLEHGAAFIELAETQPFRIVAFRALLRDYPGRDPSSLWMHAYDTEVEVADAVDPTNGKSTMPAPSFAPLGT